MKYFKVINPLDLQIINPANDWIFVNESLITPNELEKMNLPKSICFFNSRTSKHETIEVKSILEPVEVSRKKTHIFFGFRFAQSC